LACFYGGATQRSINNINAFVQQFQRDEQRQAKYFIFNFRIKPGSGLGLEVQ
jgi:hypothetical protein